MNRTILLRYIRNINLNFVKRLSNKDSVGECNETPPKVTDLLSKQAAKLQKLKNLQEKFQVNDGNPVFIKKGSADKLLFQLTNVLAAIGIVMSLYTIYCMAYNVSQNEYQYTPNTSEGLLSPPTPPREDSTPSK